MLTIGDRFPTFNLTAVVSTDIENAFTPITAETDSGKWKIFFYYPKDFTFICPTEIVEFNNLNGEFNDRNTQVYGVSTDSDFVHLAWRKDHSELQNLHFPLISDIKKEMSSALGILDRNEGVCLRATFIVDPEGIIRHVSVNDLSVGRNPAEILRTLDALQNGGLCACNWQQGDEPLKVA